MRLKNIQKKLKQLEVNSVVVFSLSARIWTTLASPVTLILISNFLSPEIQGYYYTFFSFAALQTFFELGFSIVIVQFASHEWAHLKLTEEGYLVGDMTVISRLKSLLILSTKWFSVAAFLFFMLVSSSGYFFFSKSNNLESTQWIFPWFILIAMVSLQLIQLPIISILEGCNQLRKLYILRFLQSILSSICLWIVLSLKFNLWAAVIPGFCLLLINTIFILNYKNFIKSLLTQVDSEKINWNKEIFPMQWKIGLSGLVNYFAFSLFTPVMFKYYGATVAGQMGMTWQIVSSVQAIGMAWIQTKVPLFGMLIAQKKYKKLDEIWLKNSVVSFFILFFLIIFAAIGLYFLNHFHFNLVKRILPAKEFLLFLTSALFFHISLCQSAYLRAHKKEVLTPLSIISSILIGVFVWSWGSKYGPIGAIFGYTGIMALLVVPWETTLWIKYRKLWH